MADEKKCMPFDHPSFMPSWICCQCNPKTMNGNNRAVCKICSHPRCNLPASIKVPFQEKDGIRIVSVNTDKTKHN